MLGRQPVVDRDHHTPGAAGELDALAVVGVEVAQDECPGVAVDHGGCGCLAGTAVDADRDRPLRVDDHLHVADIHAGGVEGLRILAAPFVQRRTGRAEGIRRQVGACRRQVPQRRVQAFGDVHVRSRLHVLPIRPLLSATSTPPDWGSGPSSA